MPTYQGEGENTIEGKQKNKRGEGKLPAPSANHFPPLASIKAKTYFGFWGRRR